ncbi:MAG: hypothetical protein IPJ81_15050 [Chitinophagaceae bacterium]|nr:hypothetical protein [Chitinophagaceae bacterium]
MYEENELQFIVHEEGRLRIMQPVAAFNPPSNAVNYLQTQGNVLITGTKWGVWDYFIKDNLSNTRMVLTEEGHLQQLKCSMEDANANIKLEEEQLFGQPAPANEVANTRVNTNTTSWNENLSLKISQLKTAPNGNGKPMAVGPNTFLKVMAGDQLTGTAKYYYKNTGAVPNNGSILNNIVTSFISAISSGGTASAGIKDNSAALNTNYTAGNSPLNNFINTQPAPVQNTTPKAYLSILFFDEQFNYVAESSGAVMIAETAPNTIKTGSLVLNKPATKNGYVYMYLSNQSVSTPVYFDDFTVVHKRSPILEDNAYYPYGLKIDGISAKAALKPLNKYNYQGDYAEQDTETGYNEFDLRNFDPQIGRWIQIDPYDEYASGYVGMGNDPVNSVDPDGGSTEPDDWFARLNENGTLSLYQDYGNHDATDFNNYTNETYYNIGGDELSEKQAGAIGESRKNYLNTAQSINSGAVSIVQNGNYKCHPDNTYLNIERARILEEYSKLDHANGQIDFPQSRAWSLWNGYRSTSEEMMVNGKKYPPRSLIDDKGYIHDSQVPVGGTVDVGFAAPASFLKVTKGGSRIFEVGAYNKMRGVEAGLEAHHVGQKALMSKFITGYNKNIAPAILVPKLGHSLGFKVLSRNMNGFTNARQVLARDIFELRRVHQNIPNNSLQKLIQMNKTMYPEAFIK